MTKDEALKMAIKELKKLADDLDEKLWKKINKCEEALEQPAQEPVAFRHKTTGEFCTGGFELKHLDQWTPLYTHYAPAWQLLSLDEIIELQENFGVKARCIFAIEDMLKEKNT
jgi:hypothetical protein